jgi:hypothetical protein
MAGRGCMEGVGATESASLLFIFGGGPPDYLNHTRATEQLAERQNQPLAQSPQCEHPAIYDLAQRRLPHAPQQLCRRWELWKK